MKLSTFAVTAAVLGFSAGFAAANPNGGSHFDSAALQQYQSGANAPAAQQSNDSGEFRTLNVYTGDN